MFPSPGELAAFIDRLPRARARRSRPPPACTTRSATGSCTASSTCSRAAVLAHAGGAGERELIDVLLDRRARRVLGHRRGVPRRRPRVRRRAGRRHASGAVRRASASCSFSEPVEDLKKLGCSRARAARRSQSTWFCLRMIRCSIRCSSASERGSWPESGSPRAARRSSRPRARSGCRPPRAGRRASAAADVDGGSPPSAQIFSTISRVSELGLGELPQLAGERCTRGRTCSGARVNWSTERCWSSSASLRHSRTLGTSMGSGRACPRTRGAGACAAARRRARRRSRARGRAPRRAAGRRSRRVVGLVRAGAIPRRRGRRSGSRAGRRGRARRRAAGARARRRRARRPGAGVAGAPAGVPPVHGPTRARRPAGRAARAAAGAARAGPSRRRRRAAARGERRRRLARPARRGPSIATAAADAVSAPGENSDSAMSSAAASAAISTTVGTSWTTPSHSASTPGEPRRRRAGDRRARRAPASRARRAAARRARASGR